MMIFRPIAFLMAAGLVAMAAPKYVPALLAQAGTSKEEQTPVAVKADPAIVGMTLKASPSGHFEGRFRLNGKAVDAMIDTGATFIAMNEETARSLGIGGDRLRFRFQVQTANGNAQAARVVLNSVEIGSIRARNVDAMVLRDTSLDSVLIGMSFMRKLSSWKVDGDRMQLVN